MSIILSFVTLTRRIRALLSSMIDSSNMLKIEKGKKYVMVRIDKMYVGIHAVVMTNTPNFSSHSTIMNYRVIGDNGLCFEYSPIHSSFLLTNLCASFEHWVVLAHGWALVDSRENALKYCRKALLREYFGNDRMLPFKQNMLVYGWECSTGYRKAIAQLKDLKL